jgi:hypothetical protein
VTLDQLTDFVGGVVAAAATVFGTLRARGAWSRMRVRVDGIPRCPMCGHRCATCKQRSDPPPFDPDSTPPRRGRG